MSHSKIDKLIKLLKSKELEFATRGFAMTSYNASIARVLQKGGVDKFEELAWKGVQKLSTVVSIDDFDAFHDEFVYQVKEAVKTNKGEKLSYGQAQKAVNVFLKVYVDRARLPERELADRLRPWLHVPLDSELMEYFYEEFPAEYATFVHPIIARYQEDVREKGYSWKPRDREFLTLARIWHRDHYYAWQELFRSLYPDRPVLLDTVYSLRTRNMPIEL